MAETHALYVGLGGNMGDVQAAFVDALVHLIEDWPLDLRAVSSLYRTSPVGGPGDQPDFLNGVARFATTISAADVLAALQAVEGGYTRERARPLGPANPRPRPPVVRFQDYQHP